MLVKRSTEHSNEVTPYSLLRLMFIVMAVSGSIILLLSSVGIYHLSKDYILKRAEAEAMSISQTLLPHHYDLLFPFSGNDKHQRIDINNIKSEELDSEFRQFLAPFNIIKVKVFSPDGVIAYSTETDIIGQVSRGNIQLNQALSGYHSSKLKTKDEATDLAFEVRFDVDVVGTYVPIFNSGNEIAGALEIYQDVSRFRNDIVMSVVSGTVGILIILLSVFMLAFKVSQLPLRQLELTQHKLQTLAIMDSLTSVYNRYQIIKQFKIEVGRFIRENGKLSIVLLDLDHFKNTNDSYGHPTGDKVLQLVAAEVQDSIREYDSVGRYGGEEFLIVLPGSDREEAAEIAERVRQSVENIIIEYDQHIVPVSISAGVSELKPSETNIDKVIKRADDALYLAKANGRNRVMTDLALSPPKAQTDTLSE